MNRRLALVALVGIFFHSALGSAIEPKDFKLKCRKADGHFGHLDVAVSGDEYVIDANQGYARTLAIDMGVSRREISKLNVKVPMKDCKLSDSDAIAIECTSRDAKAVFDGDEKVDVEPQEFHLSVYTLVDLPKTKVRMDFRNGQSYEVLVDYESSQGSCK